MHRHEHPKVQEFTFEPVTLPEVYQEPDGTISVVWRHTCGSTGVTHVILTVAALRSLIEQAEAALRLVHAA